MAKYSKSEVFAAIEETGVVPVYYNSDIETCKNVVKACYEGGIRAFEFTNRGEFAHEVFAELVKFANAECPGLIMGIGSIVDAPTAALYIQLGANFIVGPLFNTDIPKVANRRQVPYMPGCGSVSEVGLAQELGCEICKVFPGDVLGTSFIKGLKAPMPWSKLMVTGGVKPERDNLKGWFDAGATSVGIGSNLFPADLMKKQDWVALAQYVKEVVQLTADVRKKG